MSNVAENNKRLAKNVLVLYFRLALSMIVSLYASRVVLNVLGAADYGTYNVVGGIVVMLAFVNTTLSDSAQRFLSFDLGRRDERMLHTTFNIAFTIHLILALIIVLLAETIGLWFLTHKMVFAPERMTAVKWVYHLSVATTFLSITQVPYTASLCAYEKMDIFAYTSIVEELMKLAMVFLLQWLPYDKLIIYGCLLFLINSSRMLFFRFYCRKKFACARVQWLWDKGRAKEMLHFSGWSTTAEFALIARTEGVNVVLNLFFGTLVNAARGIGVAVFSAVTGFINTFIWAMTPQLVKYYAERNFEAMQQLIVKGSKFSFFLLFLLSFPIIIETDFVLQLWLKTPPPLASTFCRLILIAALIETLSSLVGYGVQASGRVKRYQLTMSVLFISIPIVSYAVYRWGGVAPTFCVYAEMVGYALALLLRPLLAQRVFPFDVRGYFSQSVMKCLLIVAVALLLPLYVRYAVPAGWIRFVVNTLLCESVSIAMMYAFGMTLSERQKVLSVIKKKVGRLCSKGTTTASNE